jgi:hypothetical protein
VEERCWLVVRLGKIALTSLGGLRLCRPVFPAHLRREYRAAARTAVLVAELLRQPGGFEGGLPLSERLSFPNLAVIEAVHGEHLHLDLGVAPATTASKQFADAVSRDPCGNRCFPCEGLPLFVQSGIYGGSLFRP